MISKSPLSHGRSVGTGHQIHFIFFLHCQNKMAKIMIISSWFPVSQMLNWLEVHVTVENTSERQLTITLWLQEGEVAMINK